MMEWAVKVGPYLNSIIASQILDNISLELVISSSDGKIKLYSYHLFVFFLIKIRHTCSDDSHIY